MNMNSSVIENSLNHFAYLPNMEPLSEEKVKALKKEEQAQVYCNEPSREQVDGLTAYLNQVRSAPLLSAKEEIHYARLAQQGDKQATQTMIVSNLRLVVYIAKKYNNKGMLLIDLIQEGNLGLLKAVGKFDPQLNYRFSTYASWWIKQQVQQALMNQSRLIRLPVHVIKSLNKCRQAERELAKKSNTTPSYEQVAQEMSESLKKVRLIKTLNDSAPPADILNLNNESEHIHEVMGSKQFDPYTKVCKEQHSINFHQWINKLPEAEAEIIIRRFGLQGFKAETLEEVGLAVDMSREKVRKVQITALNRMRRLMEQQGFNKEEILYKD